MVKGHPFVEQHRTSRGFYWVTFQYYALGFTLIELMIVVAIMGVLAALAIYGVNRYLSHAKTAEAVRNLSAIETGARVQYQRETPYGNNGLLYVHTFCPSGVRTPVQTPRATKVMVDGNVWNDESWRCLKFSIHEPQYYAYQYSSNSATGTFATFTVIANGDLDGDGIESIFQLVGTGSVAGDEIQKQFYISNEDE